MLLDQGKPPADARRLVTLAEAQLAQGNAAAAAATAQAAAQNAKGDPAVSFLAGRILAETGKPQAAAIAEGLRKNIDARPEDVRRVAAGRDRAEAGGCRGRRWIT